MDSSGINNHMAPISNHTEININNKDSMNAEFKGRKIANKKHLIGASKNLKSGVNDSSKPSTRPTHLHGSDGSAVNTLISATLIKQNPDQTYITQDDNISYAATNGQREMSRDGSKPGQSREKSGAGKRLPAGVRLYNQSKNPKGKAVGKKKDDTPPKPVLTKSVEEMLIQSNREKCEEIIKTSNEIHDTLSKSGIDKTSMVDALFADPLFKHVLANLLFHAKILGKNKLENFLHTRIKTFIKEYETDKQIKQNLNNIHNKIQERIAKLKSFRKKYTDILLL